MAETLSGFLDAMRTKCAAVFAQPPCDKVFSFIGTTGAPGTSIALSVHELLAIQASPGGAQVRLRGALARLPQRGECITVAVLAHARYRGYQLKSPDLFIAGYTQSLVAPGRDDFTVQCKYVFSIHHGPNTLKMYEQIPMAEVLSDLAGVRYAVVGIGVKANVAPRFVFHYAAQSAQISLFHGEGYPHKTFQNLELNKHERRLILDPDSYRGYSLRGEVVELDPKDPLPEAETVRKAFAAGGWGPPQRIYDLECTEWEPIRPGA